MPTLSFTAAEAGSRLDKALGQLLPHYSRTRLQQLIKEGYVQHNGKIIRDAARKVKTGDVYEITEPAVIPATITAENIELDIMFEDKDILVINKPAGLVVHPAAGHKGGTLVNALLAHCGDSLSGIGGVARPGIVHRLDKDTSGLMLVAKNDIAHRHLAAQFAAHSINRKYLAFVWGVPSKKTGRIEGAIGRNPSRDKSARKKMVVRKLGGKEAVTHYTVQKRFGDIASLIECKLETGRTHQVRVHLTALGHPLIGDALYGKGRNKLIQFPRQALHAGLLGFIHPRLEKYLEFTRPLPPDMQNLGIQLETFSA